MKVADQGHLMVPIGQLSKQAAVREVVVPIQRWKYSENLVTVCCYYGRDEIQYKNCEFRHFHRGRVRVAAMFVGN